MSEQLPDVKDLTQEQEVRAYERIAWAWSIIANVSGGDWKKQAQDWQDAARNWEQAGNPYHGLSRPTIEKHMGERRSLAERAPAAEGLPEITRYCLDHPSRCGENSTLEPDCDGEWVRWDDVARHLRAATQSANELIRDLVEVIKDNNGFHSDDCSDESMAVLENEEVVLQRANAFLTKAPETTGEGAK